MKIVWSESPLQKAFPLMNCLGEEFSIMDETVTSLYALHDMLGLSVDEKEEVLIDHFTIKGFGVWSEMLAERLEKAVITLRSILEQNKNLYVTME